MKQRNKGPTKAEEAYVQYKTVARAVADSMFGRQFLNEFVWSKKSSVNPHLLKLSMYTNTIDVFAQVLQLAFPAFTPLHAKEFLSSAVRRKKELSGQRPKVSVTN